MMHVGMPRNPRGYHNRHQGPRTQAEYIIAFVGLGLFWTIVIGDVLFNWLAYASLPTWLAP